VSNHRTIVLTIALLLGFSLSACGGAAAKPAVEILSPPSGTQVAVGEQVEVQYRATDATAVIRVDLEVDGKVVDSQQAPVAEGQPSMSGVLRWTPTGDGTYALIVYAYNRDRVASDPVGINLVAGEGGPAPETTATIGLILPGATGSPSGISTQTPRVPTPHLRPRQPGQRRRPRLPQLGHPHHLRPRRPGRLRLPRGRFRLG
jgi:hypothetical protein